MLLGHKIELKPNNKQTTYFAKAAGVARKAYNWALDEWKREYDSGGKPNEGALRRKLNSIKGEQFPWMLEVTKNAPQMAIIQLGQAFKNFFSKKASFPKFRKKWIDDRFTLTNDQFAINDSHIRIPRLGWVRMRESLRFKGKLISATISRRANKWFVSITVEIAKQPNQTANENQVAVGVDLGISHFAKLSTGEEIQGPKPHKELLLRVKRLSRSLSRKQKGSKKRQKSKLKLSKLHARIGNIRIDSIHKLTSKLVNGFSPICIEDLEVKGMMQNRSLSRSVADMGFHEFRRQLEYKTLLHDKELIVANRWFASSQICSQCDYKNESLTLKDRKWDCPKCRAYHDRDFNAAKNLRNLAVSSTVSACGVSSNGISAFAGISYGALKQESNVKVTYGQLRVGLDERTHSLQGGSIAIIYLPRTSENFPYPITC